MALVNRKIRYADSAWANTGGRPSPKPEAVYDDLGDKIDVILDSGQRCWRRVTVIDVAEKGWCF